MHEYPNIKKIDTDILTKLGMPKPLIIAGPCAVENEQDLEEYVKLLLANGVSYMRGGVFKPRTSPYDFQGLGLEGIAMLKRIKAKYPIKIVTEITDASQLEDLEPVVDILQIGTRNMQNYELLKKVSMSKKPILLKRGFSSTIDEWLGAAEYLMQNGNSNIILCERGIRTFEPLLRNTLDLAGALLAKEISHLPVIIDPSHATGNPTLVPNLAKASIVAGCDGFMIEIHKKPECSLCDPNQAIDLDSFVKLMSEIKDLK